jgi:prepilin-type N-terminal cleavage/methylation domain-containing protein
MSTRSQSGFTLVEVMVTSALFSVVLMGASYLLIGVTQSSERVRRISDTQETARLALDALAAEIRMSGAGASSGLVGIAPDGSPTRRIPIIYSGPDVVVTTPGGQTITTNSIFIVSSEPGAGVPASDGSGMLGSVVSATLADVQIECMDQKGVVVDCSDASFKANTILPTLTGGTYAPLIVGDYRSAVYLRPNRVDAPNAGSQGLHFPEQTAKVFAPDPKAPFGFAPGSSLGKARVSHYYLKQVAPDDWELMRSHPVLTSKAGALGAACNTADAPFLDETNDAAGVPGQVLGSGPIESLQIRFIVDPNASDDPQQFQVWRAADAGSTQNHLTVCDGIPGPNVPTMLREVRLQIVARSSMPDHSQDGKYVKRYSVPGWEGVAPGGTTTDAYPRRSFEARVVPRNLQGIIRL